MTTDALTVAVIRAKLLAVAEEAVAEMARTAFSPLLNQSRDFSTAVVDAQGRLLAQAERSEPAKLPLERDWFAVVPQPRSNLLFDRVIPTFGAFAPAAITL